MTYDGAAPNAVAFTVASENVNLASPLFRDYTIDVTCMDSNLTVETVGSFNLRW